MSAPERIWISGRHDACGQYYEEAVEAEGEHGGTAMPYVPEAALTAAQAEIARLTAENEARRRNMRETFDAMCAMRNSINEYLPMPSLESDLLQGPEDSIFCAAVAEAVVSALTAARAERDAAMAGRVKVKPLVWRMVPKVGSAGIVRANTTVGAYEVTSGWQNGQHHLTMPHSDSIWFEDFEDAEVAAQADYEARILAAIQPDTERAEPVAWRWCHCDGKWRVQKNKPEWFVPDRDVDVEMQPLYTTPQPAPAPQTREITVQEAARVPEVKALADEASYWVNNPSAWDNYDDGASEVIRRLVDALRALTDMKKEPTHDQP